MKLISVLMLLLSLNAFGVVTKNCPQTIEVMLTSPSVEKWYAIDAYENFFKRESLIGGEFFLQRAANAECTYLDNDDTNYISSVTLVGSTRLNSKNPATAVIRYSLPIRGKTSNAIGSGITYVRLYEITRTGLVSEDFGKMYYRGEYCSWGDCITDHIYLGSFDEVVVE
jgi:hypothetical protein